MNTQLETSPCGKVDVHPPHPYQSFHQRLLCEGVPRYPTRVPPPRTKEEAISALGLSLQLAVHHMGDLAHFPKGEYAKSLRAALYILGVDREDVAAMGLNIE